MEETSNQPPLLLEINIVIDPLEEMENLNKLHLHEHHIHPKKGKKNTSLILHPLKLYNIIILKAWYVLNTIIVSLPLSLEIGYMQ